MPIGKRQRNIFLREVPQFLAPSRLPHRFPFRTVGHSTIVRGDRRDAAIMLHYARATAKHTQED